MERTYDVCHRCGAQIKNVFLYQGNKYGSDCIEKIPFEESIVRDGIDVAALTQGILYAKWKSADLDAIINSIPAIGTRINIEPDFYQVVTGYGTKQFGNKRKKKEFAIRVNNIYPSASRYNNYGWISIKTILRKFKVEVK